MWTNTVGLINGQYKYLTAESFGFKINANGNGMKKKQQWSIELFPLPGQTEEVSEFEYVAIKSHLGNYLAVDAYGNVTCDSKERNDNCRFIITICAMSIGKEEEIFWAFKNVIRSYYLGASVDGINCTAKMPQSRAELWNVHLISSRGSTLFSLRSIGRKRFSRAIAKDDTVEQIKVDATESWGPETLFQCKYFDAGKYTLITSKGNYLNCDGNCVSLNTSNKMLIINKMNGNSNGISNQPPPECLFTIEFHSGSIAFRDLRGQYLAGTGHASILKTRSTTVSKDELFEFHSAPVQLALRATFNHKWVSTKQSLDLTANQNEITSQHETFQFEYQADSKTWTIRTKEGFYWSLSPTSIAANCKDVKSAAHFRMQWNEDGSFSLIANSTSDFSKKDQLKWISNRKSGQLYAMPMSNNQEPVKFEFKFENRRSLNLRPSTSFGYIGLKNQDASKIELNKITPDSILIEYGTNESMSNELDRLKQAGIVTDSATSPGDNTTAYNYCYFKMPANNKYWSIAENSIICDATTQQCAQQFVLELVTGTTILIRTYETSSYLTLNNQGILQISNCNAEEATQWEF